LIIWRIVESKFKILTEISNFSESNITYLKWSNNGNYLFTTNSNGSVYIVEFNEFNKLSKPNIPPLNPRKENLVYSEGILKKRITPKIINKEEISFQNNKNNKIPFGVSEPSLRVNINESPVNNNQLIDCLRCQKIKYDTLESKIVSLKIDSFNNQNVSIIWHNKVYDNNCVIQLRINEKQSLYCSKYENKLIRLFCANNFFYAIYDTNNLLSIFTIFNTIVNLF